ncbi:hypothetical protein GCM10022286_19690 [Gryllotalpicola daejeonensis]|uniref:Peptidase S11 D-alanyl-D-alanine carboxypeptidase A N-terminal domain-containing protein n=1 Tax=Gryllotalpicola daejeonensis TaxID=993087 RepID=A0ABP7ZKM1_9MICO
MNRTIQPERKRRRASPIATLIVWLSGLAAVATAAALAIATLTPDSDATAAASNSGAMGSQVESSTFQSTGGWPEQGQGAYVLGDDTPAVSGNQQPVPIASVAKVMTAYVVLKMHPLTDGASGPTFTVEAQDVADTEKRRSEGQSVVAVSAGEQLTERDALMAILLPSANNVAVLVARETSGSVAAFVAKMNQTARALGMTRTTYTDPSGYDPKTVSTALDQLRLAQVVAANATLSAMMSTAGYTLPVAGWVTNTDALLGRDGFVGMKTGSDDAAGGCFMFRAVRHTAAGDVTLIGVVLGQHGPDLIAAGLNAAQQLADRVAPIATDGAPPRLSRTHP